MRARLLLVSVWMALAAEAHAGVTIHFEAAVSSAAEVPAVISTAAHFAREQNWRVEEVAAVPGKLPGIVIYPHNMSEPIWLQFGDNLVLRDAVKTQFAGAAVHMEVVRLFDALKPVLKFLAIRDDGEYWEKRDPVLLENHLNQVRESLRQMKREEPAMYGPIKLKDGRIVDMIR